MFHNIKNILYNFIVLKISIFIHYNYLTKKYIGKINIMIYYFQINKNSDQRLTRDKVST